MLVADHADQRIGQAVTAQMSLRRIADLCGVLLDLRVADEELRSRAHDIISRAMRLEDERNTIIHSAWAVAEDGSAIRMKIRARRKHGVSFAEEALDLQRFKTLANGMEECSTEMIGFVGELAWRGLTLSTVLPPQ